MRDRGKCQEEAGRTRTHKLLGLWEEDAGYFSGRKHASLGETEQSVLEQRRETPAVRLIHGELDLAEESSHRIFIALFIHSPQMHCVRPWAMPGSGVWFGSGGRHGPWPQEAHILVGKADIKQIITQISVQFDKWQGSGHAPPKYATLACWIFQIEGIWEMAYSKKTFSLSLKQAIKPSRERKGASLSPKTERNLN